LLHFCTFWALFGHKGEGVYILPWNLHYFASLKKLNKRARLKVKEDSGKEGQENIRACERGG